MISRGDAVALCAAHFPAGPEALAGHLGVVVQRGSLDGCDGWCVEAANSIIRLNSRNSRGRQRFTLAHELSHLILGSAGDVVGSRSGAYRAESREEKDANQLAAELLLPREAMAGMRLRAPVDRSSLRRIARAADVTDVMAACRVATLARQIGLGQVALIGFESGRLVWRWSDALRLHDDDSILRLYEQSAASGAEVYREDHGAEQVVCACVIPTRRFEALFVQLLPRDVGRQRTCDERRRELEAWLFGDDRGFRSILNGQFSAALKYARGSGLGVDGAVRRFYGTYEQRWPPRRARKMRDARGREWVRLKFAIQLAPDG